MDWSDSTWWWIACGTLIAVELTSGTIYLLMLALGAATGAIAAHLGFGLSGQMIAAALFGGGSVVAWHRRRTRHPGTAPAQTNRDVILDVGERVRVMQWASDGSARVHYRGASWQARWAGAGAPEPGEHVIRAIEGNHLLLDR